LEALLEGHWARVGSLHPGTFSDYIFVYNPRLLSLLPEERNVSNPFVLSSASDDHSTEKSGKFSLPRLSSSHSHRPSTPSGSPKDFISVPTHDSPFKGNDTEAPKREPPTLRKRTVSAPHTSPGSPMSQEGFNVHGVSGAIKQGQNILEQIGEPNHVGWMWKRGVRYNAWKLRYCVLKGPYMYDNKAVCFFFALVLMVNS